MTLEQKVFRVIYSCKTLEQLKSARRYIELYIKQTYNYKVHNIMIDFFNYKVDKQNL